MRKAFGVPGASVGSMAPPGNCGAAHQAAINIGADVDLMSEAWWAPGLTHPDGSSTFSLWFTGGIFVNDAGERFTNESAAYDRAARDVLREMGTGGPGRGSGGCADANGQAVQRIRGVRHDEDYGRGGEPFDNSVPGSRSPLAPIDRPPFRAAAFGLSDLGTKGGLRTDARARVIGVDGQVIDGLYAAGNPMAAVSGATHPGGGNPVGASMVFGHLAALGMAHGSSL